MAIFQQPQEKRNTLQNIGLGLSAFGAGIQGRGPEFLALQDAQQRQLSDDRLRAAADDLRKAKMLYDRGDIMSLAALASNRIESINQLGGDPSDTAGILALAQGTLMGDENAYRALGDELSMGMQAAMEAGFITPQKMPSAQTDLGKVAVDRANGLLTDQQADVLTADILAGEVDDEVTFDRTQKLIKDATSDKRVDDFLKRTNSYQTVLAATPTPAGDIGLLFAVMKMFDPNSVVRESEFATAENAGSIPERIRAQYNKALRGERLTDKMRADFVTQANNIMKRSENSARDVISRFKPRAKKFGVDFSLIEDAVFSPMETKPTQQTTNLTDEELLADIYRD